MGSALREAGSNVVWFVSLRDLQWRRRRFLIATGATALVLAMTLCLAGISGGFRNEPVRTVRALGGDAWVVAKGELGPFTAATPMNVDLGRQVASEPGVRAVDPIVLVHFAAQLHGPKDINIIGYTLGGIVAPHLHSGRGVEASGEGVADERLGARVGDMVGIGGRPVRVVGTVSGVSYFAGEPVLFIPIADAQAFAFDGRALATAFLTSGVPAALPDSLRLMTRAQVVTDMRRPLKSAIQSISSIGLLLWVVAVGIVGSIVYLSSLERVRDFAVLKAIGTSTRDLAMGLAIQSVVLALTAAVVGAVIAELLAPLFPLGVEIPRAAFYELPAVSLLVGLLASLAGLRRAVSVDPASAFGGS
ncbi:MAG: ABC transporter permease [Acidimicrobiales bacterium]